MKAKHRQLLPGYQHFLFCSLSIYNKNDLLQLFNCNVAILRLTEYFRLSKIPKSSSFQVFKQLEHLTKGAISLHLVEVSPKLSAMQEAKLTGASISEDSYTEMNPTIDDIPYRTTISHTGVPVSWYSHISQVPKGRWTSRSVCMEELDHV